MLVVLLLGAVALERAALLPEPAAVVMRRMEGWLAPVLNPVLEELGLEVPPWVTERSGPGEGSGKAPDGTAPSPTPGTSPAPADDRAAAAQALALLDRVPVAPERRRGYDREDWPHWLDADGDCQDA